MGFTEKFGGIVPKADEISKPNQPDLTCKKCGKSDLARPMGQPNVVCMNCGATQ